MRSTPRVRPRTLAPHSSSLRAHIYGRRRPAHARRRTHSVPVPPGRTRRLNICGSTNTSGTCFGARLDRESLALGDIHDQVLANAGRIEVHGRTLDPAVLVAAVCCRRVPERTRREVAERRPVVASAMHDSDLAFVVEALHAAHRLVPAELRVDLEHGRLFDADRGPVLVLERVA